MHADKELSDLTANHAQPQENGIGVQTNVFVKPQLLTGTDSNASAQKTLSDLNVYHAQPQEHGTSVQINAFAQHQPPNGTEINAFAQLELTDQTVFNAQPQDSGMEIIVYVPKREYGMAKIVFAHLDYTGLTVLAVQANNIGMQKAKHVSAHHLLFGMDNIVFAHNHISLTTVNAANALMDTNGKKTDVNNVTAHIKDLFIGKMETKLQLSIMELTPTPTQL